ncbi:hypothetical protein LRC537489_35750 [Mycobacterium riyadhense]
MEVATERAQASERGAGVTPGADQFAIAGLDPYVAAIEHRLLVLLWEAIKDGVLCCQLDTHVHAGHSVAREARAQQATESAMGGEGGHSAPAFKAAMGG